MILFNNNKREFPIISTLYIKQSIIKHKRDINEMGCHFYNVSMFHDND